jgi:hypothetical protein
MALNAEPVRSGISLRRLRAKRYSAELERMRSAELGQRDFFFIGPLPHGKTPSA